MLTFFLPDLWFVLIVTSLVVFFLIPGIFWEKVWNCFHISVLILFIFWDYLLVITSGNLPCTFACYLENLSKMLAKQAVFLLSLSGRFGVLGTLSVSWSWKSDGVFKFTLCFSEIVIFNFLGHNLTLNGPIPDKVKKLS